MQENYLALDIGAKRIGVAVGSVVPFGRGYINGEDKANVLQKIGELIGSESITHIVVGIPKVRSGDITQSQHDALEWAAQLKEEFSLPVSMVDESYTSQEAENQLKSQHIDVKTEKWRIDERSAELILNQFLHEIKA